MEKTVLSLSLSFSGALRMSIVNFYWFISLVRSPKNPLLLNLSGALRIFIVLTLLSGALRTIIAFFSTLEPQDSLFLYLSSQNPKNLSCFFPLISSSSNMYCFSSYLEPKDHCFISYNLELKEFFSSYLEP